MTGPGLFGAPSYALSLPDGTALKLGPLAPDDAARLGEAIGAMDPWRAYGYPASALTRMLTSHPEGAPRFAFNLDGAVVGAAIIHTSWLRGPYLQFLALLPEVQGRALGQTFLQWMEREARGAGERNLWVAVSEINTGATRFYERHGFTRVAELPDLAYDGRTEFLLRKRLS